MSTKTKHFTKSTLIEASLCAAQNQMLKKLVTKLVHGRKPESNAFDANHSKPDV